MLLLLTVMKSQIEFLFIERDALTRGHAKRIAKLRPFHSHTGAMGPSDRWHDGSGASREAAVREHEAGPGTYLRLFINRACSVTTWPTLSSRV